MKPKVSLVGKWRSGIQAKAFTLNHDNPEVFVQCQWQKGFGISLPYLIYRIVLAATFFGILVSSLCETAKTGSKISNGNIKYDITTSGETEVSSTETILVLDKDNNTEEFKVDVGLTFFLKWPIYLTNWGIAICTAQAIIGAIIVLQRKIAEKNLNMEEKNKMPFSYKCYWVTHTIACVMAPAITILYWSLVYKPAKGPPSAVGVLVHAINSILMLIDLILVTHPHRIQHFYFPISIAFVYSIFSVIYFLVGGTGRNGTHKIYPQLDWKKPFTQTLPIVAGAIVLVVILHSLIYGFSELRSYVGRKLKTPRRFFISEGEDNRGASLGINAFDTIDTNGINVSKGLSTPVIIMNDV